MASTDLTASAVAAEPTPSDPQSEPPVVDFDLDSSPVATQDPNPTLPTSIPPENVESSDMQGEVLTETDLLSPVPISQHPPAQSESLALTDPGPVRRRGRKKGGAAMAGEFLEPEQFPEWLPKDWKVMKRPRPTGPIVDTYYLEPSKNRQLRSKKAVLQFIADGATKSPADSPKRRNKKNAATKAPANSPKRGNTENAATKTLPSGSPESINSEPIPEKVTWVYTNSAADLWTPFIGEETVPEHTRLDWKTKFNPLSSPNGDSTA